MLFFSIKYWKTRESPHHHIQQPSKWRVAHFDQSIGIYQSDNSIGSSFILDHSPNICSYGRFWVITGYFYGIIHSINGVISVLTTCIFLGPNSCVGDKLPPPHSLQGLPGDATNLICWFYSINNISYPSHALMPWKKLPKYNWRKKTHPTG